jgi:hypothetical protein
MIALTICGRISLAAEVGKFEGRSFEEQHEGLPDSPEERALGNAESQAERYAWQSGIAIRDATKATNNEIKSLYADAKPRIKKKILESPSTLSKEQIQEIVKNELDETFKNAAARNPKITWDVLTGDVTIEQSTTIEGVKITGGKINLYKIAAGVATGAIACKSAFSSWSFKWCIERALQSF